MIEFCANTQNFSEPTKELDAAMRADRIAHDGIPVLEWCISNVVGRYDTPGECLSGQEPRTSRRSTQGGADYGDRKVAWLPSGC